MVRPPCAVWVDLSVVYQVPETVSTVSDGLDLTVKVPGFLSMWRATTTGHWVGWVTFAMGEPDAGDTQTQWIIADALSPREARKS